MLAPNPNATTLKISRSGSPTAPTNGSRPLSPGEVSWATNSDSPTSAATRRVTMVAAPLLPRRHAIASRMGSTSSIAWSPSGTVSGMAKSPPVVCGLCGSVAARWLPSTPPGSGSRACQRARHMSSPHLAGHGSRESERISTVEPIAISSRHPDTETSPCQTAAARRELERGPVAGIEALEYFDPPASPRAKPTLVGSCPCAVFGTVAADGRTHAHRIYLSLDGRAKADLGIRRDRKPRDPKKSARRADGQVSTAGCGVIWGNPEKARHLVSFEGIENAAVSAHALRAEIEAEEIYVVSAINAGGVKALIPYPATALVTVAADRDEAKQGAGYRRGERAARSFGLRNRDRVEIRIALPGEPGESTDWLEIFARDGVDAVRSGILGAASFVPTRDEIENFRQKTAQAQNLKAIAETYPLPPLETLRLEYQLTKSGEIWVHKFVGEKSDEESGEKVVVWTPVSSPLGVSKVMANLSSSKC
jgi:hypothetical protein